MTKPDKPQAARLIFLQPGGLSNSLELFAKYLREDGYRPLTIEGYRKSVAHFAHWMRARELSIADIDEQTLVRFAAHRCRCPGGRRMKSVSSSYVARVRRFIDFLEERDDQTRREQSAGDSLASARLRLYRAWLLEQRGLSERTVDGYEHWISQLIRTLGDIPGQYTAERIRDAIRHEAQHRSLSATSGMVTSLRSYLRYLAATGQCRPGLDGAVPTVAGWRLSALPRYLVESDVERVIESCEQRDPAGLRDRAILLLLARLGLRGGDIVALRFDDLDWGRGQVSVRGKSRRSVRLPLPQDAGDAILAYIKDGRPPLAARQVFLCAYAPHRPLRTASIVSAVVASALRRAGIDNPPSRGAHLLRHSAATSMLRGGASLDAIGAVLRHRSADTTAHYAKVDIKMLAPLALPWPENAPC